MPYIWTPRCDPPLLCRIRSPVFLEPWCAHPPRNDPFVHTPHGMGSLRVPPPPQHVHTHAACPCQRHGQYDHAHVIHMSVSMKHVHVHASCPCNMSIHTPQHVLSIRHVRVHAICPCIMSMSMQHVHTHTTTCPHPCDMSISMRHVRVHATYSLSMYQCLCICSLCRVHILHLRVQVHFLHLRAQLCTCTWKLIAPSLQT